MRVNISIPDAQLALIDTYAKAKFVTRSRLITDAVMGIVQADEKVDPHEPVVKRVPPNQQPITSHFCSFCMRPKIGLFRVAVHDWEEGEKEVEARLCQKHLDRARKEGEVYEIT